MAALPELIDTHAHTNFETFDEDRAEMYARAREAGVSRIVEVGVGLSGSRRAVERAAKEEMVFAAAGLHPTGLETFQEDWAPFLELARSAPIVAVGECGLDYYWMKSPEALQEESFRRQIALARELNLPFIVHCRDAEEEVIRILRDAGYPRGVVHCFGGTREQAEELLGLGMRITFCGNVTYKNAQKLRAAARVVPLELLMLETDSPFLAPQARRGKRNEPAFVKHTAEMLAELHEVSFEELAEGTTRNAKEFFGLS